MARVPAKMYRKITQRPYTRREFMGGVPALRILQFHSGNQREAFPAILHLVPEERGQIRHTALEAMRITAVRYMDKRVGRENYHLQVRVYPHHVLRQNKQASGAGADRVSMGMRLAFGKPIGTAARIEGGQTILTIRTRARGIPHAKEALRKCTSKISMPCHIEVFAAGKRSLAELEHAAEEAGGEDLEGAGTPTEDLGAEAREAAGPPAEEAEEAGSGSAEDEGAETEERTSAEGA